MKRKNYISWDQYFMGVAMLSAERSKDPNTQVGACIVDCNHHIISLGYNGAPTGYSDDLIPWDKREGDQFKTKYVYSCHSEMNAILNAPIGVRGMTLYVTLFPCHDCAKAIVQSGIKEIIYLDDKYEGTDSNLMSKKILDTCGILYRKYQVVGNDVTIKL